MINSPRHKLKALTLCATLLSLTSCEMTEIVSNHLDGLKSDMFEHIDEKYLNMVLWDLHNDLNDAALATLGKIRTPAYRQVALKEIAKYLRINPLSRDKMEEFAKIFDEDVSSMTNVTNQLVYTVISSNLWHPINPELSNQRIAQIESLLDIQVESVSKAELLYELTYFHLHCSGDNTKVGEYLDSLQALFKRLPLSQYSQEIWADAKDLITDYTLQQLNTEDNEGSFNE